MECFRQFPMQTAQQTPHMWMSYRSSRMERIQRTRLFKVIADRCKRTRVCFCCGATNGPVK